MTSAGPTWPEWHKDNKRKKNKKKPLPLHDRLRAFLKRKCNQLSSEGLLSSFFSYPLTLKTTFLVIFVKVATLMNNPAFPYKKKRKKERNRNDNLKKNGTFLLVASRERSKGLKISRRIWWNNYEICMINHLPTI